MFNRNKTKWNEKETHTQEVAQVRGESGVVNNELENQKLTHEKEKNAKDLKEALREGLTTNKELNN